MNPTRHPLSPSLSALLIASCTPITVETIEHNPPMTSTPTQTAIARAVPRPPLDLRAPSHTETATFALG